MVLEHASRRWGIALAPQGQALQGQGAIHGHAVLLALPLVWMNQTGEVVHSILQDRNLAATDLILVYDDLDLSLGALKIKTHGGAGGHNGLRSVISCLETQDFCIDRPPVDEDPAQYVLSTFAQHEREPVNALLSSAVDVLECLIREGASVAMNRFHAPPPPPEIE
jgi:PTH1 family peptidyl-tRNA hydrolase